MNTYGGATNMNQSFGGYSSKMEGSAARGANNLSMTMGSPGKAKPQPAGILNSKTLAE